MGMRLEYRSIVKTRGSIRGGWALSFNTYMHFYAIFMGVGGSDEVSDSFFSDFRQDSLSRGQKIAHWALIYQFQQERSGVKRGR